MGAWGRGRAERGLLAMKKDDDGGKKPIKRVCATNKYVCCTGCGCWWVGVGLCLDMVIDVCPGFLWCVVASLRQESRMECLGSLTNRTIHTNRNPPK